MEKLISLSEFMDKSDADFIMNSFEGNDFWLMNANNKKQASIYLSASVPPDFLSKEIYRKSAAKGELLYFVKENGADGRNWLYTLKAGDTL